MDLSAPLSVAAPGARGAVLRALFRAGDGLTGRELARRARLSQAGAARVLGELVDEGLVRRTSHPPAFVYELNREHIAYEPLAALDAAVPRLLERIREYVSAWSREPVAVVVFGSLARGEARSDSDVDLLVVRAGGQPADVPIWEAQLSGLEAAVENWTGNPARVVEYTSDQMTRRRSPFVRTVRDEGITVWGALPT